MEKKEAKLTMGLLAALAMSPAVSTANDSSVQQETTQIIKDGVLPKSLKYIKIQKGLLCGGIDISFY